jgi:cytochrome c biogenesis protein CcmG/thiol:disulfide interchange protein DsbE
MKTRFILPLVLFAALVAIFAIGIKRAPEKSVLASVLIGKPAPEFDLPSLTEPAKRVKSQSHLGKHWLLNVWATWCAQCRVEHPTLLQIQNEGQVPIVGLNWKDDDAGALEWLNELGNPFESIAVDKRGHAAIDWGVYGAPETFLVDDKGIVVYKHVGAMTPEVWQREFLPRIQGRPPGST